MKKLPIFTILGYFILASGCASMMSTPNYPLRILSSPDGADVSITDTKRSMKVFAGKTPASTMLSSNGGYFQGKKYEIEIQKEGYEPHREIVDSTLNGWYFGNIMFSSLYWVGFLIVDPLTGSMWKLDRDEIAVNLRGQTIDPTDKQIQLMAENSASNKTTFAIRFGDYTFYNKNNHEYYGRTVGDNSLDITFRTANPNISWRIAIDGAATESDDLFFYGFSGAVVFHTPQEKKVRGFYGFGLGSYAVEEYGANDHGYETLYEGSGIGYKAFGGIEIALSAGFALSMELALRSLTVGMTAFDAPSIDANYSGRSLLFGLNFGF